MKSTFLIFALPLLVSSLAEPKPKPQSWNPIQAACECPAKSFNPPPCTGSFCECKNQAVMACWISKAARCSVALQTCPSPAKPITDDYPACGRGLPNCAQGRICRQVDLACNPNRNTGVSGCLGLCVPPAPQPTRAAPPPPSQPASNPFAGFGPGSWGNNAAPKGGASSKAPVCPLMEARKCADKMVCVQDPHDTLGTLRGPSWKCVDGQGICGGFQNTQCREGSLCVKDPRMECMGQGCTGVCA